MRGLWGLGGQIRSFLLKHEPMRLHECILDSNGALGVERRDNNVIIPASKEIYYVYCSVKLKKRRPEQNFLRMFWGANLT